MRLGGLALGQIEDWPQMSCVGLGGDDHEKKFSADEKEKGKEKRKSESGKEKNKDDAKWFNISLPSMGY